MMRALYTAASGMTAQELNLDNIANNLSNSSTAGFRSRRLQFEDLIYQNLIMPGAAATQQTTMVAGLQVGLGTRSAASEVIQQQGDFSQTGNPLDLTIQGQGFFQVLLPDGQTAYTRAGSFHLDGQGNLVTQDGNPVQPSITIPAGATSVTVGSDGTVSVTLAGQTAAQQVGTLQLALFNNPGGLNSTGRMRRIRCCKPSTIWVGKSRSLTAVRGAFHEAVCHGIDQWIVGGCVFCMRK
jgi:flagellar basal-body rod protein FlgG